MLVQRGTLRVGDPMVAGAAWGRVRALIDDHGNNVKEAPPSTPVQVLGLSDVADAGDQFIVAPDDKTARDVADKREHFHRLANLVGQHVGRQLAMPRHRHDRLAQPLSRPHEQRQRIIPLMMLHHLVFGCLYAAAILVPRMGVSA